MSTLRDRCSTNRRVDIDSWFDAVRRPSKSNSKSRSKCEMENIFFSFRLTNGEMGDQVLKTGQYLSTVFS